MKKIRKKYLIFLLNCLIIGAVLSGCSNGNAFSDEGAMTVPEYINEGNSSADIMGNLEHEPDDYLIDDDTGETFTYNGEPKLYQIDKIPELFLDDFSGYICYAGNDQLICLGDKVIVLDSNTLKILHEVQGEDLGISFYDFWNCEVYADENGYTAIGTAYNAQDSSTQLTMVEFDRELRNVKVINVKEWVDADHEIMVYKFPENTRKLLYSTMEGLYLYDSASEKTIALDTGEVFVLNFAWMESSNQILFVGNDSDSNRVSGRLTLGEEPSSVEIYGSSSWGKMWSFGEFALIEEADVYGKEKEGQVFCYSVEDGIRQYPLVSKEERGSILPSGDGKYYTTKTLLKGEGYIVRIYSSEDGQLVREFLVTYENYGEKLRLNNVLICENSNKVIMMVSGLQDHEEGTWLVAIDL